MPSLKLFVYLTSAFCLLSLYVSLSRKAIFQVCTGQAWSRSSISDSHNGKPCNESLYTFETNDKTIFNDEELWRRCGLLEEPHRQEARPFNHPRVWTKCGTVDGVLLSRKYQHRPARPGFLVPNIVHYVILANKVRPFTFLNYISFKSVEKFLKPQFIFVHGDRGDIPGKWWKRTVEEVPNIFFIQRTRIVGIQQHVPGWISHETDLIRIQALQDNGGIYLDTDAIVLKSFDPLRQNYSLTMGRASSFTLCSCILVSAARQPFVCIWYNSYRDYDPKRAFAYGYNAVQVPHQLAALFPRHVHVEERSVARPSWADGGVSQLFDQLYDWSENYAVHVMKSYGSVPSRTEDILGLNTTLGQILRHVYL